MWIRYLLSVHQLLDIWIVPTLLLLRVAAMNRSTQISFLYYTNNLFKENYLKINWGLCVCFGHS